MDIRTTVGELVAAKPGLAGVFEKMGIDYCCGGKIALEEACNRQGLDPRTVAQVLAATGGQTDTPSADCASMSLVQLTDHIMTTHHTYLKAELPRLAQLMAKTVEAHGAKDPRLLELQPVVAAFCDEIGAHMMKEERILFPLIQNLEVAGSSFTSHCGSVGNPIRVMELEHESAGDALAHMKKLTDGYTAPESACNTWRALCSGLARLERDTHEHIHKENNILFPRALEAETGR